MGDTTGTKKGWFKGVRQEFKKIVWPDKKSAAKQTVVVIIISVVLGIVIKIIDTLIQTGIGFIA